MEIQAGKTTIEKELKLSHGRFFAAVLNDDYPTALDKADSWNTQAFKDYIVNDLKM